MSAKKLLVIDGNSILNRAFYGVRPMTTSDGRPTNALYGFINIILKQLESISPDAAAIAFDLREPTFRHKKCDFYKANRKGMPDELAAQLDGAKRAAEYLGLHVLSLAGYEADDILGTCARLANEDESADYECYILTGDRDSYQLVGEKSYVLYCTQGETALFDTEKIKETYGLCPSQLIDLKALMGDSSDNIPGVAGIGEKTAIKLMQEFGSLDALYESYKDSSISKGIKEKLEKDKEMAYVSRFLAEICTHVPLPLSFSDLTYEGIKKGELLALLREYELRALIKRLGLENETVKKESDGAPSLFDDEEDATESDFTDYKEIENTPDLSEHVAFFADTESGRIYIYDGASYVVPLTIKNVLAIVTGESELTVYDSKELYRYLLSNGEEIDFDTFDVMLAQYVISPSAKRGIEDVLTSAKTTGYRISDEKQKYLCCVKAMYDMKGSLSESIERDGLSRVYYDIELPLAKTLARMENEGFLLDTEGIAAYGHVLEERLSLRQNNIYSLAGCQFNINSPKQLGEVLYKKLSLPTIKKNKSGPSTDAETLEKLRPYHPIINEILDYRVVSKLNSTYVEGLLKVCGDEGRVHTTFRQALTLTGRLSSVEPNLQNIPIKQAEGRELRKFFIAKKGHVLVDADYSQIELRILAELSGDEVMCDTFRSGEDIHTTTASQVFGVSREGVTAELRKRAKAVNFGIVYGISDFSLAGDIGTTRAQAGEYIEKYFEKYPKIKLFLDGSIERAKREGFVTTLFGRRRYIPELSASNKNMQNFGKRVAMNSPIQGTAADIIKLAMLGVEKALREELPEAKLILQIHDELIVECPEADAERAGQIVREQMEGCIDTHVPLEVSLSYGTDWYDAHG